MNLALSALLIILLLLPAFSFRIGISIPVFRNNLDSNGTDDIISRNVSKALSKLNFTETVFLFSIAPIVLHLISLLPIHYFGYSVDFSLLLNIFSGKHDVLAGSSNNIFDEKILSFLKYTLIETLFGAILGWMLISFCSRKGWLLRMLTGNNIWFKTFIGTNLTKTQKKGLNSILVEILTETKETSIVYSGLLKNYELMDNSNELACITLTGTSRRDLRKAQQTLKETQTPKEESSSYYHEEYGVIIPIPGNSFIIPGKEIKTLSITYMKKMVDPNTSRERLVPIT